MTRRTILGVSVLGAVMILALLFPLRERLLGPARLRFPYLGSPIAEATYASLAARPGWAKTRIEIAPGIELNGLIRRPSSPTDPWVLFYPGNDRSQLERGQAFLVDLAGDSKWGLAVFAYRGYDSSGGKSELASLRPDAPAILAQLCASERIAPSNVHLVGFSIGGHMAVHAARGAFLAGQRAATLTLLASVNDIVMYRPSFWARLSPGEDYQTQPFLPDVPAPVLVIQGDADQALHGPSQGRAIAAALGTRATYYELHGVDHVPLLSDAHALELVRAFIRAHSS